ncbi:MAG: ABC transporter permease [Cutibacterium sp.]|nr:ABC transporter permease [Cutibacterium sp.]
MLNVTRVIRSSNLWIAIFCGIVTGFVACALFAEWLAPQDPFRQNLLGRLKPPGTEARDVTYLLGSDELGRDLLSRLIYGARVSLFVAIVAVIATALVGTTLGMAAAYLGGRTEIAIMRVADAILSIPALLFAVIIVAILGPGLTNVIIVLALTRWPRYARVAHAQTLSIMNMHYVRLARYMGASWPYIIGRHILPNIASTIIVVATLEFGIMVLFEAGLSFLGFGVQAPTPSWGAMLAIGRDYIENAWWLATFPGLCLFLLVMSGNVLGDHLRDRLDPRLK